MKVRQILKMKGSDGVFTIAPDATLAAATEELAARRIGVLIVSRAGALPEGILSERDIVRELARRGAAALACTVAETMSAPVQTCSPADDADAVLSRMTDGRFRHMPVIDEDRLVAMMSQGDVVKARLQEVAMDKDALESMIMGH